MRDKLALLAGLMWLAAACGPWSDDGSDACREDPDAGPRAAPELEIGSGIVAYAPLVDGDSLGVHKGAQLGFHVYLTLRARGVAPGTTACPATSPLVTFEVTDETTGVRRDVFVPLQLPLTATPEVPGAFEVMPPREVRLKIAALGDIEGQRLRVRAALDDRDGVHVESSVVVTARAAR